MIRPALLAALFILPAGCGLLGKRVSEDDCTKWDKHYRESLEETSKKILNKCKDSPAAKAYLKSLEENVATSADAMGTGCHAVMKIGTYTAEEEKCFLGSSDAKTWSKCEHKPTSAMSMYIKAGEGWVKSLDGMCKGSSSSDDSEDEDTPKKKKKKKKSDDDE